MCSCPTMVDPPNSVLTCQSGDCKNCTIYCIDDKHVQLNTRFKKAECTTSGVKPAKPKPINDNGKVGGKSIDIYPQMAACAPGK